VGIWDKIQHLYYSHAEVHIMIVPWHLLVNDTDLCRSPKSLVLVMISSMYVPICNRFYIIRANNGKMTSF